MSDKIPPAGTFYLQVSVTELDGSLDPGCEAPGGYIVIEDAIYDAKQEADEHGVESYIYECKAVRRIVRGKTRIINLKK